MLGEASHFPALLVLGSRWELPTAVVDLDSNWISKCWGAARSSPAHPKRMLGSAMVLASAPVIPGSGNEEP